MKITALTKLNSKVLKTNLKKFEINRFFILRGHVSFAKDHCAFQNSNRAVLIVEFHPIFTETLHM
jgi:hypothetical protein